MTDAIEAQVERFAPGFRDRIVARSTLSASEFGRYNPNLIGGDIGGGANTLRQIILRPIAAVQPYLCSASTPPGGGVHGMCGFHAAETVLAHNR